MQASLRTWCGILFAASLAIAVTWHLSSVYAQQRGQGRGGAGGMGAMGGGAGGMGGGPGGMGGGFGPPILPPAIAASGDFVYVVQNDTLYQLSAEGLVLTHQIQLPPAGKAAAAKARK